MKISFKVEQPSRCRSHSCELPLYGYYGTEEVIADLQKVLHYHELKFLAYKESYIKSHGKDQWDRFVEGEK